MKCADCRFYDEQGKQAYKDNMWGFCNIVLPPIAKREWGHGCNVTYNTSGCDLGKAKDATSQHPTNN